ncbi:MAG: tRNA (adenine(22)-N(1))-methyltransferase TrmK, partial [Oscillospiraceae bacterium]|nr:tRNA (adenine(22)-N(1))-methyltransferase TrmK [Oscillospiraceae bacterium]
MSSELSPRLNAVAELVPACTILADIGTDHGFLPLALLRRGRIARAVCADLRAAPLASARRAFEAA